MPDHYHAVRYRAPDGTWQWLTGPDGGPRLYDHPQPAEYDAGMLGTRAVVSVVGLTQCAIWRADASDPD